MNTKQLVIIYIASLSVTWCLGHMLGIYASINPMIVLLMVSLLLALGWLVTQLISEKEEPITQRAPAQPATSQRKNTFRASSYTSRNYASQSGSSSNSSGADLTTLATLAILSNTDTGPTCTGGVSDSGSSCGDSGSGGD
ncbi:MULTISPECIES: hypothetical protein [Pseudomonas]|uniref:hypothetical protein n=1 Tax=Pseudomonas TaxID=286 RepID=UPI00030FA936|nr:MULTISPECIES: hypothetical protein [Pseudomonas]MBA1250459.1 hypothetical protein [Pseudomonas zeshuii]MBW5415198.1 hypothetical protein [Pseudomonas sp. MAG002Y]MCG7373928.1 hypothetical protein [Pseudomonas luteola]QEU26451.1 hypothetical protein FOB45_01150 [Pseudomonas luteola]RRW43113.1 hypothetical protein EGJ50_18950 [Pseudomonas luteola]